MARVKTVRSRFFSNSQSLSYSGSLESLSASSSSSSSFVALRPILRHHLLRNVLPAAPPLLEAVRHQKLDKQLAPRLSQSLSHQTASLAKHLKQISVDAV
jgi:hypothetical protein